MPPGKAKAPSFDEFAQTTGMSVRGICPVCALDPDVLEQVHRAYDAGYRGVAIRRYLAEGCGIDVPVSPVHNHFARLHHRSKA